MRIVREWWGLLAVAVLPAADGCGSATDLQEAGGIAVVASTSGPEPDRNGYRVQLDGAEARSLGAEDSTVFEQVTPGSHALELRDVADNCLVRAGPSRSLSVTAGLVDRVAYQVTCTASATLRVVIRTAGAPADPDGYELVIPTRATRAIGINETVTMTGFGPGPLGVQLAGLAPGCAVQGTTGRLVTMVSGDTTELTFEVRCGPPPPGEGTILVTVRTQAVNAQIPNGYTLILDGTRATGVAATQTVTLAHVPVGLHSVKLSDVPSWCIAGSGGFPGANPVQVTVAADSATPVTFGVLCLG
jgi:hypothetical protein